MSRVGQIVQYEEIFKDCTKNGVKIKREDYCEVGRYPIIDQGQEYISGYSDNIEGVYNDVPAIIFGDHTRIIKYIDRPFFLGADGVKLLKCKRLDENYKYLYYALLNAKIPNTGYNRHYKWLKEVEIPYPPLEEQKKIVEILDKASNLIFLRKKQIEKLDLLVKAKFIDMFGRSEFKKVKLEELCENITKGTTPKSSEIIDTFASNRVPFLKVYHLTFNGEMNFAYNPTFINKKISDNELARSKVYPGDLLMNIVGPPLGKFTIVPDDYPEWNINQAIVIFRCKKRLNKKYLLHYCLSTQNLHSIIDIAIGIRQQNLSLQQCRNIEIELPPIELQNQFASFVEKVEHQKSILQQGLEKLELNYNALMQRYFE
ncbi:MAG TPA: restriction endonuclease subunit S [Ruminiclostridium sp.]